MTDLVQVVLSRPLLLLPPSPLGYYGISRQYAAALRGACSRVTAPANILIITGGSGLPRRLSMSSVRDLQRKKEDIFPTCDPFLVTVGADADIVYILIHILMETL